MIEGFLALSGLLFLDLLNNGVFKGEYRSIIKDWTTLVYGIFYFIGMVAIQVISQVPMTIRDAEMAGAIIFAGPAEELFFRGVLISGFERISEQFPDQKILKYKNRNFGIIDISAIIVSSLLFASFHVNYYEDARVMIVTFATGIFLGTVYLIRKDITANIIGHLLLNIIVVGQQFWLVNL
jgi:membrane protease YdiL (CAAX protease family)